MRIGILLLLLLHIPILDLQTLLLISIPNTPFHPSRSFLLPILTPTIPRLPTCTRFRIRLLLLLPCILLPNKGVSIAVLSLTIISISIINGEKRLGRTRILGSIAGRQISIARTAPFHQIKMGSSCLCPKVHPLLPILYTMS